MVVVGLAILAFVSNLDKDQKTMQTDVVVQIAKQSSEKIFKTLKIGEATLNIEVVDTNAKRTEGLSGKEARQNDPIGLGLGENEGMLFVFDTEGYYGFWMKDMKFPIDMAWFDKDKKIIHIENALSPETYPKVFSPSASSLYVLEVQAGFLGKNNIKIGDLVAF